MLAVEVELHGKGVRAFGAAEPRGDGEVEGTSRQHRPGGQAQGAQPHVGRRILAQRKGEEPQLARRRQRGAVLRGRGEVAQQVELALRLGAEREIVHGPGQPRAQGRAAVGVGPAVEELGGERRGHGAAAEVPRLVFEGVDQHFVAGAQAVEDLVRACARALRQGAVFGLKLHAGAVVDEEGDGAGRVLGEDRRQGPGQGGSRQREGDQGDQQHAEKEDQQTLQVETPHLATVQLAQEAEAGEVELGETSSLEQVNDQGHEAAEQAEEEDAVEKAHAHRPERGRRKLAVVRIRGNGRFSPDQGATTASRKARISGPQVGSAAPDSPRSNAR